MKILFFGSYFYPYLSGITTYPLKILSYLAKKNEVTALTFNHSKNSFQQEKIQKIRIKRMPYLFKVSKGFVSPQSWWYFLREAGRNDVIFLNFPNAEGLLLAFLSRIMGKKVIGIFHCRVSLSGGVDAKLIETLLNIVVWWQMFFCHKIVIYTHDYFNSMKWEKVFRKKTIQIYPPVEKIISDKKTLREFQKLKGEKYWVGFAGRIAKEKGLEYLIEALANLKLDKEIELVIAGPSGKEVVGENHYFKKIEKLLQKKNIFHRFLGILRDGNLGAFYQAIDVLVLPSVNQTEAFGMVQVEAMLVGKPVIASNLPGVREPIKITGMGKIVEPRDVNGLFLTLEEVLENRNNFSNKKMIELAKKTFSARNTEKFYDNLIAS